MDKYFRTKKVHTKIIIFIFIAGETTEPHYLMTTTQAYQCKGVFGF
jgi:hypothetical protein